MATSKQEQLYNEIVEYYSYADRLIAAVQDSSHKLSEQQFSIIEDVVTKLEECADQLTTQYIDFIKNGESENTTDIVRQALNKIMAKIEECQNKILIMYKFDDSNNSAT
jgi:gas vesicle protein